MLHVIQSPHWANSWPLSHQKALRWTFLEKITWLFSSLSLCTFVPTYMRTQTVLTKSDRLSLFSGPSGLLSPMGTLGGFTLWINLVASPKSQRLQHDNLSLGSNSISFMTSDVAVRLTGVHQFGFIFPQSLLFVFCISPSVCIPGVVCVLQHAAEVDPVWRGSTDVHLWRFAAS